MNENEQMSVVLGTVAMEPKGEYSAEAYYEKLNTVLYNDSTYMAIKPSHDILPTDTEYWQLIGGGAKKEEIVQVFDTVADMKLADLKVGMTVQTLGYYEVNDGGGATYKITNEESQSEYQEELENGLYATLIIEGIANVMQYGVSSFNQDNTQELNNAFKYNTNLNGFNGTINVSGSLVIEHHEINYNFKNLKINVIGNENIDELISIYSDNSSNRVFGTFKNLNIDNNGLVNESLCIYDGRRLEFEHLKITGSIISEIAVKGAKVTTGCNVVLRDIRCENGRKWGLSQCSNCIAINLYTDIHDCYINNIVTNEYNIHIHNEGTSWFDMIHGWNWNYVLNSILIDTYGSAMFDNIYCDTVETMIKINGGQSVTVNHSKTYFNSSAYGITSLVPKPFVVDTGFVNNSGRLRISNSHFTNYGNGNNDLIVLPANITRLTAINITNTYTGTYKVKNSHLEYYNKTLTLDFEGYSVIPKVSNTITLARMTTIKGFSQFYVRLYSESLTITGGVYAPICKISDDIIDNLVVDRSMIGFILNAVNYEIYPITWRINENKEICIRVPTTLPNLIRFSIYLDSNISLNSLSNN